MKKKDLNDLRGKSLKDLEKILKEKMLEVIRTKTNLRISKEKNLKRVKMLRREFAQINTVLKEKRLIEKMNKSLEKSKE